MLFVQFVAYNKISWNRKEEMRECARKVKFKFSCALTVNPVRSLSFSGFPSVGATGVGMPAFAGKAAPLTGSASCSCRLG